MIADAKIHPQPGVKNYSEPRHKRSPIIVEMVGPPGAGKSTTCIFLTGMLQEKQVQVLTLQDIKDYIQSLSVYNLFLLVVKTIASRGQDMLSFSTTLASKGLFSFSSLYRFARLSVFDTALEKIVTTRQIDLVLLEQWMIQELWSATIFKLTSYQNLAAKLKAYHFKCDYVFYLKIDTATASERIQNRATFLSRFDRMEATKRIEELKKHKNYLFQLYNSSTCKNKFVVSTQGSPAMTADQMIQHIELV